LRFNQEETIKYGIFFVLMENILALCRCNFRHRHFAQVFHDFMVAQRGADADGVIVAASGTVSHSTKMHREAATAGTKLGMMFETWMNASCAFSAARN
jgi:hypothetical protein